MATDPNVQRILLEIFQRKADELIEYAATRGVVVTIEQQSLKPPAMGNYKSVASVRLAHGG